MLAWILWFATTNFCFWVLPVVSDGCWPYIRSQQMVADHTYIPGYHSMFLIMCCHFCFLFILSAENLSSRLPTPSSSSSMPNFTQALTGTKSSKSYQALVKKITQILLVTALLCISLTSRSPQRSWWGLVLAETCPVQWVTLHNI